MSGITLTAMIIWQWRGRLRDSVDWGEVGEDMKYQIIDHKPLGSSGGAV